MLHQRRLAVLSRHLEAGRASAGGIVAEACAATNCLNFARPALPGTLFSRCTAAPPSAAQLEALGAAADVLRRFSSSSRRSDVATGSLPDAPPQFARPGLLPPTRSQPEPSTTPAAASAQKHSPHGDTSATWVRPISVEESEFGYCLHAVLPGVRPHDVRAALLPGGKLIINGIRHARGASAALPELMRALPEVFGLPGRAGTQAKYRDLPAGQFRVKWELPRDANPDSLRAEFKNGVLLVKASKQSLLSLL